MQIFHRYKFRKLSSAKKLIVSAGILALAAISALFLTNQNKLIDPLPDTQPINNSEEELSDWYFYDQKDEQWWHSEEAANLANKIVLDQLPDGGWRKSPEYDSGIWANSTFDNEATWKQIRILARVYTATGSEIFKSSCLKGIDFLLDSQYPNGGWPQIPEVKDKDVYHSQITFNDHAMTYVLATLKMAADRSAKDGFAWIDDNYAQRAQEAVDKGVECILKCQIKVGGKLTVWCQQHDKISLLPVSGRAYEPAALCTWESVEIVEFLQSLPDKNPEIIQSINAAVRWFDEVKIRGMQFAAVDDDKKLLPGGPGDLIWARFYDIESNIPIFGDRDGKIYYDVSEISGERRMNYSWYGDWPLKLLSENEK